MCSSGDAACRYHYCNRLVVTPPSPGGGAFWNSAIGRSVCPSVCLSHGAAACLGYRHAGCMQLSHRRPPGICGLRTRRRTDVDPPRFLDRTVIGAGAYRLAVRGAIPCYYYDKQSGAATRSRKLADSTAERPPRRSLELVSIDLSTCKALIIARPTDNSFLSRITSCDVTRSTAASICN